jgi:alpha-tubulin suppressor-like RCC1 family protein
MLCIAIVVACSSDAQVGCSPGLTCSLRQARFAPPALIDAGPQPCDLTLRRCTAARVSAGGEHTCAVSNDDNVLCWGDNSQAQRGPTLDDPADAHATQSSEGVQDAGLYVSKVSRVLNGASQVAAGGAHTCALLSDGSVRCWGRAVEGQVDGRSDRASVETPVDPGVSGAVQIAAGALHTCAVVPEGVVCWGSDQYGQSGQEPSDGALAPSLIADTQGAVEVTCGVRHTCARFDDSHVSCWGELIDDVGAVYQTALATPVAGLESAIGISAGGGHSCALTADYHVVCWGHNESGQLGDGTTQTIATPIAPLGLNESMKQVGAGGSELAGQLVGHSCAVTFRSEVVCWGRGAEGQLGIGEGSDQDSPGEHVLQAHPDTPAEAVLPQIERVALGALHSCGLDSEGRVFCWGDNRSEQLGAGLGFAFDRQQDKEVPGRALEVSRFGPMR